MSLLIPELMPKGSGSMRFTLTLVDDTNEAITIVGDMEMMTFGTPDEQRCPFAASGFFATDEKTDPLLHWWATGNHRLRLERRRERERV